MNNEPINKVKVKAGEANFRDTTSGFIAKGTIQSGDTGWIEGGAVYDLIYGNN